MKYLRYILFPIVITLPFFILTILIYLHGYRFPYWDEILYIPLYDKFCQGTLTLKDLFFLQNNHRPFLPRVITLILAKISSWNELFILYFSLFSVVILFIILAWVVLQKKNEQLFPNSSNNWNYRMTNLQFLSLAFISLWLFSWSQMENWVWGLQLMMFITNLLCIFVLFVLFKYKINLFTLIICVILTTLASYSFANGLLVWFISIPLLSYKITTAKTKNSLLLFIWILCAILVFSLYFTNYQSPSISSTHTHLTFTQKCLYFILYIGSPISACFSTPPWHGNNLPEVNVLQYLPGIIGLTLWIFIIWKSKTILFQEIEYCKFEKGKQLLIRDNILKPNIEEYFFWVGISLFTLLSGILLVLGRSDLGISQALSSRYITTSCLFWCSLLGLINFYEKCQKNPIERWLQKKPAVSLVIFFSFIIIFLFFQFSPIYLNQKWHQITKWKNLGWYALSSGYDGRLFWTDLWGDKDFIMPQVLKNEIFPIFRKYNLANINQFNAEENKKALAKVFFEETQYFIKNQLWKPAVCYLYTARYLDPQSPMIEELKKQIPSDKFVLYEKYQEEWLIISNKH